MSPNDACLDALERIVHRYRVEGPPSWDINIYALDRDGAHAAAAIWDSAPSPKNPQANRYSAFDASGNSMRESAYLLKRPRS